MMRSRKGYILVEAIVAMALLSMGMISIHRALGQANLVRALAADRTNARFFLEEVMGTLEIQPYLEPGNGQGNIKGHPRFHYTYAITIVSIPLPPIPPALPEENRQLMEAEEVPVQELAKVSVTIFWRRLGTPYQETVETLFPPERLPALQMEEFRVRQGIDEMRN
jgi:hypothetical protein